MRRHGRSRHGQADQEVRSHHHRRPSLQPFSPAPLLTAPRLRPRSLWKEIDRDWDRGVAARKAGQNAQAYIYWSRHAFSVLGADGIKAHPQYKADRDGQNALAQKKALRLLEELEKMKPELKRAYVETVRTPLRERPLSRL